MVVISYSFDLKIIVREGFRKHVLQIMHHPFFNYTAGKRFIA